MAGLLDRLRRADVPVAAVLPICDDGGSTREILRVFGGPAIGDVRSAVCRLGDRQADTAAVLNILNTRLSSKSNHEAFLEWHALLHNFDPDNMEDPHPLFKGVSDEYRVVLCAFLYNFHQCLLRAMSSPTAVVRADGAEEPVCSKRIAAGGFDFRNGSVGNFFLTGARLWLGNLDAALFLLARLAGVSLDSHVLTSCRVPGSSTLTVSADLEGGTVLHGQCSISHPFSEEEPFMVTKTEDGAAALPAKVKRLFFEDNAGSKVRPKIHPRVQALMKEPPGSPRGCNLVVYGRGSLYTSLVPNLMVSGMGPLIEKMPVRKVLVLNGGHDRETRYMENDAQGNPTVVEMSAAQVVSEVARACNNFSDCRDATPRLVTDVVVPECDGVTYGPRLHADLGKDFPWLRVHRVPAKLKDGLAMYDDQMLLGLLRYLATTAAPEGR